MTYIRITHSRTFPIGSVQKPGMYSEGQRYRVAIMGNSREENARCDEREHERQNTLDAWNHYQCTGLHLTTDEADAWLAKLEAGEDAEIPECHT